MNGSPIPSNADLRPWANTLRSLSRKRIVMLMEREHSNLFLFEGLGKYYLNRLYNHFYPDSPELRGVPRNVTNPAGNDRYIMMHEHSVPRAFATSHALAV
jgi:hypothetical protein